MNRINEFRVFTVLVALALGLPGSASALSTDRDQPINLEADEAELDQTEGVSTYVGNVVVTQGSMKVESDRMVGEEGHPTGGGGML